jgi:hypothetical protein
MIRLKWNTEVQAEKAAAVETAGLYVKAGMIPFVGGVKRAIIGGDEGEAEFRFRPTASDRLLGDFLEEDEDGQNERTG